ncbi:uncharacterized protein (DUF2236 family) [Actinoplanes lutulentus]|uniref:Uncharacterized protein (DUF2236 family) n=1 Tax=Actinoplanes lutulentus TaxID=1287878 RepID=A0A327ZJZ2_9ACTN|nr:oxygenase MpaB family protein [Actinoplanes lutulentus]MBB2940853.1 uncharacterized protein (DUF2236 family) [Actinoplanes lutulentus]RAK43162.1 uncharacterized protein (DUF2236 family) [Actinoplanes lutulentus]
MGVRRGSVAWRYFGDARNMLLGPQILVLQVAHPVVGAGVLEHSNYRDDPWRRLVRTFFSLSTIVYGGERGAASESARLRELHREIKGVDAAGRRYHALNPEAYLWVHATPVQGGVEAHRVFGKPLTPEQIEEYYADMREVGLVLGLREQHLPVDWAAFQDYYAHGLVTRLEDNQAVRDVIESVHRLKKPFRWIPGPLWWPIAVVAGRIAGLVTVGTLPPLLRERFGMTWTPGQERRLRRFTRLVRVLMALVIPPLRIAGAVAAAAWTVRASELDKGQKPGGAALPAGAGQ